MFLLLPYFYVSGSLRDHRGELTIVIYLFFFYINKIFSKKKPLLFFQLKSMLILLYCFFRDQLDGTNPSLGVLRAVHIQRGLVGAPAKGEKTRDWEEQGESPLPQVPAVGSAAVPDGPGRAVDPTTPAPSLHRRPAQQLPRSPAPGAACARLAPCREDRAFAGTVGRLVWGSGGLSGEEVSPLT